MGVRVAVASQTPLVRPTRAIADMMRDYGNLPDPLPLTKLQRGVDYSVTPGGVARMIQAVLATGIERGHVSSATWTTLANGFPVDLEFEGVRMAFARMPPELRDGYAKFKEVVWNAINGLPPLFPQPLALTDPTWIAHGEAYAAWSRVNAQALLARAQTAKPDVVYVNDWQHLPQGPHLKGLATVFHMHAPVDEWTPPGWREFLYHHMQAYDAVIVSCARYKRHLEKSGFPPAQIHHVYPWLNPEDYDAPSPNAIARFETRFAIKPDDEVILHIGRMDPVKGQGVLIQALAALARKRPDAKLVLIGNGSFSSSKQGGIGMSKGQRVRAELEALARECRVADRVVFTGHLRHVDVLPALARCNVFAFPSVAEGFGLAAVEAWLFGKPVVVSRGAGVSELVRDDENGIVLQERTPRETCDALERVLAHPTRASRMGAEGRETARACDVRAREPDVHAVFNAVASRSSKRNAASISPM